MPRATIRPETYIPHWHGEECDYGMAIEVLLKRDESGCLGGGFGQI